MDQDAITKERDCTAAVEADDRMAPILEQSPHTFRYPALARSIQWCSPPPGGRAGACLDVIRMRRRYASNAAIGRVGTDAATCYVTDERIDGCHVGNFGEDRQHGAKEADLHADAVGGGDGHGLKIEGTPGVDTRRGGLRLLGLAPPIRLGEKLVETYLCLGAFPSGEDAFRELRAQLGDFSVDVESVVHVNLQCLDDRRPPPVVGGPGQGLRQQPAEPAGGGADFVVA
ncbi:MAG TPA: hypothetical protein VGN91_07510 [Bosea sp. (in: a-proteobacteria)]|nr:hypothetical protein [Bosea sp. (in: a-proteobacteria)]